MTTKNGHMQRWSIGRLILHQLLKTGIHVNDIVCTPKLGGVIRSYSRRAAESRS